MSRTEGGEHLYISDDELRKRLGVGEDTLRVAIKQPEPKKRGRPKIGEKRDKPWLKAKVSRATWYRRQKGK